MRIHQFQGTVLVKLAQPQAPAQLWKSYDRITKQEHVRTVSRSYKKANQTERHPFVQRLLEHGHTPNTDRLYLIFCSKHFLLAFAGSGSSSFHNLRKTFSIEKDAPSDISLKAGSCFSQFLFNSLQNKVSKNAQSKSSFALFECGGEAQHFLLQNLVSRLLLGAHTHSLLFT